MGLLLAQSLAGLVGRLTLIDADRVGWENLDAMPLASEQDVGRLKVEVATRALLANRSERGSS
jgi:molybdopterin/thiamine biosynthesis adenylyltransferase